MFVVKIKLPRNPDDFAGGPWTAPAEPRSGTIHKTATLAIKI
jgi:hypothetical protein